MAARHNIIDLLSEQATEHRINNVRIGLGYTAVTLDDGRTGVAYTFRQSLQGGCTVFMGIRPLAGKPAYDLLQLLNSHERIEAAVGLATANALANVKPSQALAGDVLDALQLRQSDKVGMIGYFAPLLRPLKAAVATVEIFEEQHNANSDTFPPEAAHDRLSSCDIALITSTSLINHSLDYLLDAAQSCRDIVLLGSSTPLLPEAFRDTPVTYLSGITIDDSEGILQVVSEGGGTRLFKPFVTKWNVPIGAHP